MDRGSGVVKSAAFWGSLAALGWTHVGYPLTVAVLARLRGRPVRKQPIEPTVTLIVAAHDEETVIERRVANLLALDYPRERLDIVVASDGSTDRTLELVTAVAEREPQVRPISLQRSGKVVAQNDAVRATDSEIVAFSDANTLWKVDALRELVSCFADPDVAYVCGAHFYTPAAGTNREGVYARYEGRLRLNESRVGSVTAGVGPIYAVRRADYLELDPRFGHDLALPYRLVRRGRRAVVEPAAVAWEKPARDIEDEFRRKIRMFEHCWLILFHGRMLRGQAPAYALALLSHRHLRYASGLLHLALLGSSASLAPRGGLYRSALAAQLALLAAAARPGLVRYYVLVTWATVPALVRYLRAGVPAGWEKAPGTR